MSVTFWGSVAVHRVIGSAAVKMAGSFEDKLVEKMPNYLDLHDVSM